MEYDYLVEFIVGKDISDKLKQESEELDIVIENLYPDPKLIETISKVLKKNMYDIMIKGKQIIRMYVSEAGLSLKNTETYIDKVISDCISPNSGIEYRILKNETRAIDGRT